MTPAPQIKEAIVEVVHIISPERISGRIDEQIVDVAVDVGITGRGGDVDVTGTNATTKRWSLCGIACSTNYAQEIHQECISERIVEQIVYVSVLEILEQSVKVESVSPQRRKINAQLWSLWEVVNEVSQLRVQLRAVEQIVAAPVPHIVKELLEVNEDVPQRIAEQIVEEWVGLVQTVLQERVSERVT